MQSALQQETKVNERNNGRNIDLLKIADDAKFNSFHVSILAWCALVIIFDGYDLAVSGIALPSIMKDMNVDATRAGMMVSSALFGAMCGAVLLGSLADRIGRRRAIALCVSLFSVFTAAAGLASDPIAFGIARFIAGIGIGGVMPAVVAQMTEYSPRRWKTTLVTVMFSGYSVGGMIAAMFGKGFIGTYGWQAVFYAAAAPVLVVPWILKYVPESLSYLVKHNRTKELSRICARLDGTYVLRHDDAFVIGANRSGGTTLRTLFGDGRGVSTFMFWIVFFMCLFMVYALSSWLAKLMANAGYSLGSALTFVLILNIGGIFGAVGGGMLADRMNIRTVLVFMFALAGASIALLGFKSSTPVLYFLLFVAGASTIGTQIVVYAYAGQYYPLTIRSTGIGVGSGVGRIGAISAPVILGTVVGMQLPLHQNFLLMAIPAAIAMIAVAFIDRSNSSPSIRATDLEPRADAARLQT
ncbi:MFS transporter [Cupriavidus pinatubonensis]|uniref:MFS transporter n=1 Tax=Cupriavidus pinatubonensis TaxID=248026 RepID=UPI000674E9AF|nr:MFS transporter [Cupriavidus pinatubonensis]TPQ39257.1 MFS transporter [Cupriavidus pinatubonensis]